jgi:hypothetical protein
VCARAGARACETMNDYEKMEFIFAMLNNIFQIAATRPTIDINVT